MAQNFHQSDSFKLRCGVYMCRIDTFGCYGSQWHNVWYLWSYNITFCQIRLLTDKLQILFLLVQCLHLWEIRYLFETLYSVILIKNKNQTLINSRDIFLTIFRFSMSSNKKVRFYTIIKPLGTQSLHSIKYLLQIILVALPSSKFTNRI